MTRPFRDYGACQGAARTDMSPGADRMARMKAVTDILWRHLQGRGVDWLGFYEIAEAGNALLLRVCRPKPACSPIGLHGVCGKAWRERAPCVVEDVHALGEDHIVCDPANLSEVVVPCLEPDGSCWGVLDLDSRSLSAFTEADGVGLRQVLLAAGLTA